MRGGKRGVVTAPLTTVGLQVPEAGLKTGYLAFQYLLPIVWFLVGVFALVAIRSDARGADRL
jgi:hypothetical protein